jgi:phosphoglycolate phosphatase
MKFKGIIFDLDGTLVNSLEDLADSMNTVLQNHNFPTHAIPAYKHFIGNGIRNLVYKTLPETNRDEILITECYDLMIEEYRNNSVNKTKPYDGITGLLDELVSRNMKLAVFSNKADEFTKKIVLTLLPEWNFEAIVGLSNDAHKKPNPFVALQISEKLGIRPEDMIYVGDSGTDMQTANNAGMYAVGALWGFRTKEELISNGAMCLINNPLDLISIIE